MARETSLTLIAIALLGLGCGPKNPHGADPGQTPQGQEPEPEEIQSSFAVTSSADLPVCEEKRRGQLFYIETENTFKVCKTTGWAQIDIKGRDGVNGKDGLNGKDSSLALVSKLHCSKSAGQLFTYSVVTFSNQMIFVTCSVSGSVVSVSESQIFDAGQIGSAVGGCFVTYDVDNTPSGGFWSFTVTPRGAQYNDPGSAFDKQVVKFEDADCKTYTPKPN